MHHSSEGENKMDDKEIKDNVKDYYGKQLHSNKDLKTKTCCCSDSQPVEVKAILPSIADEIKDRFYGCGSPLPPLLKRMTVLDLGCGTGRDVYLASKLVGESGHAIGIDMTSEQIAVANKYKESQMAKFGFKTSNVSFIGGYIEDLQTCGIEDSSVDVIISNCVINLSPAKEKVLSEAYRVLRPGGELFFSDIFADRRIPTDLTTDPLLRGECLGGAMYIEDFRRLMRKVGWADFRYTDTRDVPLTGEIKDLLGFANFTSRTVRAFKLDDLEDICEDYGQVAYYLGNIDGHPHYFDLDDHHRFFTGKPMPVCGNTASMISNTRYASAFRVIGDRSTHYGKFDGCSTDNKPTSNSCSCS